MPKKTSALSACHVELQKAKREASQQRARADALQALVGPDVVATLTGDLPAERKRRGGPRNGRLVEAKIVAALRAEPATVNALASALDVNERTVWRHLLRLESEKTVERQIPAPHSPHKFRHVEGAAFAS